MTDTFPEWIKKQMLRGVSGYNLDAYLMALEGWRRGLTLTWYEDLSEVSNLKLIGFNPLGKSFSLYSKETDQKHYFYRSRGDKVSNEAVDIVHDKHLAKKYLNEAGVSTPKGITFERSLENNEIIKLMRDSDLNYPIVLKPVCGSLGKGVMTNIQNDDEFYSSLKYVREKFDYEELMLEEYVEGDDYRVYVVGEQVVAATKRIPANVIGDGVHTLLELIEQKNEIRKENPYLQYKLLKINDTSLSYLQKSHLVLENISKENMEVQLNGQANITVGGDPIDVTDTISEMVKRIAVDAIQSIPGLLHAGVDIIVNSDTIKVIEINGTADIGMHLYPLIGKPRNILESIIDYYFPETTGQGIDRTNIYFSYREIREVIQKKQAQEIIVNSFPKGKIYSTRYIVKGKVQKVGYRDWIRKQATKAKLNGYTRNLKNGNVVVVISGNNKKKLKEFKDVCNKGSSKSKVDDVIELSWNHPIKLGFEIRKTEKD